MTAFDHTNRMPIRCSSFYLPTNWAGRKTGRSGSIPSPVACLGFPSSCMHSHELCLYLAFEFEKLLI